MTEKMKNTTRARLNDETGAITPETKVGIVVIAGLALLLSFVIADIVNTFKEADRVEGQAYSALESIRGPESDAKNGGPTGHYFDTAGAPDRDLTHGDTPVRIGTDEAGTCYLAVTVNEFGNYYWTSNETIGNHRYDGNVKEPVSDCYNIAELIDRF